MCMANHDNIIERHIYTSEWAVSNLLPSNGAGPPESLGKLSFFLRGTVERRCGCVQVIPETTMGITPLVGSEERCHF